MSRGEPVPCHRGPAGSRGVPGAELKVSGGTAPRGSNEDNMNIKAIVAVYDNFGYARAVPSSTKAGAREYVRWLIKDCRGRVKRAVGSRCGLGTLGIIGAHRMSKRIGRGDYCSEKYGVAFIENLLYAAREDLASEGRTVDGDAPVYIVREGERSAKEYSVRELLGE